MNATRISDLLSINPRFLRSVNLERDFGDALALDGYVATAETSRYLHRIGRGLRPESGERAWRITGDERYLKFIHSGIEKLKFHLYKIENKELRKNLISILYEH